MKNFLKAFCVSTLLLAMAATPVLAEEAEVTADAFSSASVSSSYADYALTGDELMDAINSTSGFYSVSTTNPDGSANAAVFIYGCQKLNDTYYIQAGLAPNQSLENINRTGEAVAMYAKTPDEKPFAMSGARMRLSLVTDETVIQELNKSGREGAMYLEVVDVLPLG